MATVLVWKKSCKGLGGKAGTLFSNFEYFYQKYNGKVKYNMLDQIHSKSILSVALYSSTCLGHLCIFVTVHIFGFRPRQSPAHFE